MNVRNKKLEEHLVSTSSHCYPFIWRMLYIPFFGSLVMPFNSTTIIDRLKSKPPLTFPKVQDPLLEPFQHIHSEPGKGVRDLLFAAFNHWIATPKDRLDAITNAVAKLHTASLLIDDIEDGSQLRRGLPAAHTVYGIPRTINAANYMYFLASKELYSLPARKLGITKRLLELFTVIVTTLNPSVKPGAAEGRESVVDIVTSEILALHQGQGLEILWRDTFQCPLEEEYIDMVINKTGGLLRMAIRVMEVFAKVEPDQHGKFIPLVNLIAIYYQIRDDYMNLQSKEYESKKGLADDLTEGKFSFPIIHGIRLDTGERLMDILKTRPTTPDPKNLAISYLMELGSFTYTFKFLEDVEKAIMDEIHRLGGNPGLETFMARIRCPDLHSRSAVNGNCGTCIPVDTT